jgi:hypothetical protein
VAIEGCLIRKSPPFKASPRLFNGIRAEFGEIFTTKGS